MKWCESVSAGYIIPASSPSLHNTSSAFPQEVFKRTFVPVAVLGILMDSETLFDPL